MSPCINCSEANDGGYETEEVGPFCSMCWQLMREHFIPAALLAAYRASDEGGSIDCLECPHLCALLDRLCEGR